MNVAGIVRAAAAGRCLGLPKALVSHQGKLLVERATGLAEPGECRPLLVVLGTQADQVRVLAGLGSARTMLAEDWAEGIGASRQVGLAAAAVGDVGARGWLRAPPDLVTPVACDGMGDPVDLDTSDDIDALLEEIR
ncbi:MAG: NTP transferase domain-containing protein [Acidimicrobiales bacterium]